MRLAAIAAFAALSASAWASPAAADDFTLDDVTIATGVATYHAAHVAFTGATLSRDETAKLLAAPAGPGADRFARIDVARLSIPELVAETKAEGYRQTITYRDVVATQVAHGVARILDAAGARLESARAGGAAVHGEIGALHAEGVDFPALARIAGEPRKDDAAARVPTIDRLSIAGATFTSGAGERLTIGRIAGAGFRGRPLAAPMQSLVDMSAPAAGGSLSPIARRAMAAMLGDIVTSFDVDTFALSDLAIAQKADADAKPLARIGQIAFDGLAGGRLARLALEKVEVADHAASATLDRASLSGLDLKTALAAAAAPAPTPAAPHFDRFEIAGLAGKGAGEPFGVKSLVVEAKDWRALLPTGLSIRLDGLAAPLAGLGVARSPLLAAIGYERTNLSAAVDARFDAAKGEFSVKQIALDDPQIGALRLSALLSRVPQRLFDGDMAQAAPALLASIFWRADLHLEDRGALGKIAAANARKTGRAEADARQDMARAARGMVQTLFSAAPGADPRIAALGDAAAAFAGGAQRLDLSASAPDGISLAELGLAAQLGVLAQRLTFDAKAR